MPRPRRFKNLHPEAFIHPEDRAALSALRKVPGIDRILRTVMSLTAERFVHAVDSHQGIQLGRSQYPSLYKLVERSCKTLDMPVPTAYLQGGYTINAHAFGYDTYTLTLYAGLVDLMDERELLAVIAHELGHIKCEHMLYKSAAHMITNLGLTLGTRGLGVAAAALAVPVRLALLRWSRAAELSCDRAALLVTQNPEVTASAIAKLAGGTVRYAKELNVDAVLEQARRFEEDSGLLEKAYDTMRHLNHTHPDPIRRVREIYDWSESEQYAEIMKGNYLVLEAPTTVDQAI